MGVQSSTKKGTWTNGSGFREYQSLLGKVEEEDVSTMTKDQEKIVQRNPSSKNQIWAKIREKRNTIRNIRY